MSEQPRQSRLGLALFVLYTALYAAFVAVAAFGTFRGGAAAGGLASPAFGGLSWAVVAGFSLILGAIVLAVLYAMFARPAEDAVEEPAASGADDNDGARRGDGSARGCAARAHSRLALALARARARVRV